MVSWMQRNVDNKVGVANVGNADLSHISDSYEFGFDPSCGVGWM